MKKTQDQLDLLIGFLQELATENSERYTEEKKQQLLEAITYLKQTKMSKQGKVSENFLKGVGAFVRAYVIHEIFDDD